MDVIWFINVSHPSQPRYTNKGFCPEYRIERCIQKNPNKKREYRQCPNFSLTLRNLSMVDLRLNRCSWYSDELWSKNTFFSCNLKLGCTLRSAVIIFCNVKPASRGASFTPHHSLSGFFDYFFFIMLVACGGMHALLAKRESIGRTG